MRITKFISLLSIFYFFNILTGGLSGDTQVLTPDGYIQISQLKIGDAVLSYNFESKQINARRILNTESHFDRQYRKLFFDKDVLRVGINQKIFVHGYGWLEVSKLVSGLQINQNENSKILHSSYIYENIELYEISIEEDQNFFITQNNILVHNFAILIPLVLESSWLIEVAATVGITVGAYLLDGLINGSSKSPGQPTENDGFVPKKNWDGRKIRNPNGPEYGWPDEKENVWVPTGPNGHGGPHWDVEHPDGSYENVFPGGKTRGQ
ncbi:MAG TPA: polymorphic toxin type 37 domain-containing protein [Gammaproteobacteria bacterium]|nr:polymorphic toxin type 37 domain-containing protein [Gammaproteobacteria bacterium]